MKYFKFLTIPILLFLIFESCSKCEEVKMEVCGGNDWTPKVDLIVIMDQSTSMNIPAQSVSDAAETALTASLDSCETDLRVTYLGVDGASWPTTLFNVNHRDYLYAIHGSGIPMAADLLLPVGQPLEQGADAVADLSKYFDWRDEACRAILYISDEPIDGNTDPVTTQTAIDNAISVANENNVTTFAIFFPLTQYNIPLHIDEYNKLCDETFGMAFIDTSVDQATYIKLMPQVICNSCNACNLNDFSK